MRSEVPISVIKSSVIRTSVINAAVLIPAAACLLSAAETYFPPADNARSTQWEQVAPDKVGWDAKALDRLLDYCGQRRSSHVVLLLDGKILAERTWDPESYDHSRYYRYETTDQGLTVEDVASVQKSVVSVLFGIARERGLVQLDDPVSKHLGRGWSQASPEQEAAIRMRHLLAMSSGLNQELQYRAPPGQTWSYNTVAYRKIMPVLVKVSGMSENELTQTWLTKKIGMRDTRWYTRSWWSGEIGLMTTARDLARFGLLMLAEGKWNGHAVLGDVDYLRDAAKPWQPANPAYGRLWWLNQPKRMRSNGRIVGRYAPTGPDDLYAAFGALDRKVYVAPSMGLVAVRIGEGARAPGGRARFEAEEFNAEFWRLLTAAAPQ